MKKEVSMLSFYKDLAPAYDTLAQHSPSFPRADMVYGVIQPYLNGSTRRILDVGIGTGLSSKPFMAPDRVIIGVDGSPEMLKICQRKNIATALVCVDFARAVLPFETNKVDAAISANTFYLLSNAREILGEMLRVTKPGGLLAFNFEARGSHDCKSRLNDATMDIEDPIEVRTYAMVSAEVRNFLKTNGAQILLTEHHILEKLDESRITLETWVCRTAQPAP